MERDAGEILVSIVGCQSSLFVARRSRNEPAECNTLAGAGARPIIYRLDLMGPGSYFLAQRFAMQDKDLIYIAHARTDRLQKFISIISSVASPYLNSR